MAIQLPPNSTGTVLDTVTVATKDREIVVLGDGVATTTAAVGANGLKVDPSGVTQPVSGTVTANQGTAAAAASKWPVEIVDSAGVNIASVSAANALKVDGSAVTQPISGTVTANQGTANATPWNQNVSQYGGTATTLGAKASASSIPVVPATDWVEQDTVGATVALNALNAAATVALAGRASVGMFLAAGTLIGTIVPEISFDGGTTWVASVFIDPASGAFATSTSVVFASANTATSLSMKAGGGVSNARVRVSAFTSGTANCTLRATANEEEIIVVQGKPFTSLGVYAVSGRTAVYAALAASAPLVQLRNGTAGVFIIPLKYKVMVATTIAATTAGATQRELIIGRSWTVSDTGTAVTLTGNNNKRRTSMATSIADLKHGAPLTAGTRTLDANAIAQAFGWEALTYLGTLIGNTGSIGATAATAAGATYGASGQPVMLYDINRDDYPIVLAQNEGLLLRFGPDAQPAGATNQTYFEIVWAEATAF